VQSIKDDIAAGRLKPGDRLPTRRELCEQYGIAAMTAAKVVRILAEQGLVVSDVGRGVFVTDASAPRPVKLSDTERLSHLEERVRAVEERLDKLSPGS
jgi:DNA-binding GntR family transcriptional regulator